MQHDCTDFLNGNRWIRTILPPLGHRSGRTRPRNATRSHHRCPAQQHQTQTARIAAVDEWRCDLQTEINEGWTSYGQTNHLLKTIACYGVVFERLTGDAFAEFVQTTAINAPGYETYCRYQHEIAQRSRLWARSAEKYWWALGGEPQRSSNSFSGNTLNLSPM
jgi:hypothetical protein